MEIIMRPVGYVHSEYTVDNRPPRQSILNLEKTAVIEILEEFQEATLGLEKGMHIVVLFNFHKSTGYKLRHFPHGQDVLKGVFASRSPNRPNGIGMSICEIEDINGRMITIRGVDMLDETPVLDIKPYSPKLNPENRGA
ncbi:MAG: tRNA (N6-threonylcarbamoyladenosine(37)-N6)-methyltransferase TrmO [Tissierellia bacterium]|nr:tRNA (N6-threonylcarbamoyladenosine(37)-N6)-methyltransferase TrmO [Tissierellia bacterium]